MADVRPFRGIRYSPAKVPNLSAVVTQPYDKITPEMQRAYYDKHHLSFVRLILPMARDPYSESKRTVEAWLKDGVLYRDQRPGFYVIHQEFEHGGRKLTRKGFIGVVRVEEFEKGVILPHERTLSKPKADRLNMTRATEKDFEQIFLLYDDPQARVDVALAPHGVPTLEATDEYGVYQRVWAITDPDRIAAVRTFLKDKTMLIADGHHRYETALNYRKEMEATIAVEQDAALRFKTAAFINIADPGLVILPTHRLLFNLPAFDPVATIKKLSVFFSVEPIPADSIEQELTRRAADHVLALYAGPGRSWLLRLVDKAAVDRLVRDRSTDYKGLDVTILHSLVIEHAFGVPAEKVEDHVAYERKATATIAAVDSSKYQAALLLNPTRAEQVSRVAAHGERMPQKSTDFYPKLVSGLVFFDVGRYERV
jgi:uncharacterized protein (DUF1015 family)